MNKSITKKLSPFKKGILTRMRKVMGWSDFKRWSNVYGLIDNWDSRTIKIAGLIEPNTKIIEFGAGRMVLKNHLPENCEYTPSDIVDRGENSIVCDLNSKKLPAFKHYDVAVFSGVLEYVNDVPGLIRHLSDKVTVILASYAILGKNNKNRRIKGWVNDYTTEKFILIFKKNRFSCLNQYEWEDQIIFKFIKETPQN